MLMREATKDRFLVALLFPIPTGCATLQSIEPVQRPPAAYRGDVTARIEFVAAEQVMFRCFEKGATVPSVACRSRQDNTIVITNPCAYPNDNYAARLCHEMAHTNGWGGDHKDPPPPASKSPEAKALASK